MNQKQNGGDRINNTQRKVIAGLASQIIDAKFHQAQDKAKENVAQILNQIREDLGVVKIDTEITEMESRITMLHREKEAIGFSKYTCILTPGSPAKQLMDTRVGTACKPIDDMKAKKIELISHIWTSKTISEAHRLLEKAKKL